MVVFVFLPARSHDARESVPSGVDELAPATVAEATAVLETGTPVFEPARFGFAEALAAENLAIENLAIEDVGTA
jgi:hypothetical protein